MTEYIAHTLSHTFQIPLEDLRPLNEKSTIRTVTKGTVLYNSEDLNDDVYIITSGIIYDYYLDRDGVEKIKRFYGINDLVGTSISGLSKNSGRCASKALTNCTMIRFSFADFNRIANQSIVFERLLRKSLEKQILLQDEKEYMLFMLDARERYNYFVSKHADLLEHIPLKLIASYINITPETLSRIRKA